MCHVVLGRMSKKFPGIKPPISWNLVVNTSKNLRTYRPFPSTGFYRPVQSQPQSLRMCLTQFFLHPVRNSKGDLHGKSMCLWGSTGTDPPGKTNTGFLRHARIPSRLRHSLSLIIFFYRLWLPMGNNNGHEISPPGFTCISFIQVC